MSAGNSVPVDDPTSPDQCPLKGRVKSLHCDDLLMFRRSFQGTNNTVLLGA
jgi:hypothetical protein